MSFPALKPLEDAVGLTSLYLLPTSQHGVSFPLRYTSGPWHMLFQRPGAPQVTRPTWHKPTSDCRLCHVLCPQPVPPGALSLGITIKICKHIKTHVANTCVASFPHGTYFSVMGRNTGPHARWASALSLSRTLAHYCTVH
jgi:hypothetical protein